MKTATDEALPKRIATGGAADVIDPSLRSLASVRAIANTDLLRCVLSHLDIKELCVTSPVQRSFSTIGTALTYELKPLGGEILRQQSNLMNGTTSFGVPITLLGAPVTIATSNFRFKSAVQISEQGQAVALTTPLPLTDDFTLCAWTRFEGGSIARPNFVQPLGWKRGEHVLVSSAIDDQVVFYSEDRDNALGLWANAVGTPLVYKQAVTDPFEELDDGWHHFAVIGDAVSTRYYVDGNEIGSCESAQDVIPEAQRREHIAYIGNVGCTGVNATQTHALPWGCIADFRLFERALCETQLKLVIRSGGNVADRALSQ